MGWQGDASMFEWLQFPFMQKALIASVLIGYLAGFFGVFVVQRKMSFLGSGLAHSTFGGVALALYLGLEPLYIAVPFTIGTAILITLVRQKSGLADDATVGIFFALTMAMGILFLSLKKQYTAEANQYLFGSILSVQTIDLVVMGGLVLLSPFAWRIWSRWAYVTFDRELAMADRVQAKKDDLILSIWLAAVLVVASRLAGIILISAFLVIPAASARLVARTFFSMTLLSIGFAVSGAVVGIVFSFIFDIPGGAMMILVQSALFFILLMGSGKFR